MAVVSYRFDLLDADLNLIGELHPADTPEAQITNNTNQTIKRGMTNVRLDPAEADAVRPLSDRVRPMMLTADGEFPLGVFIFTETPRERWTYGRPMTSSFVDQLINLDQDSERAWWWRTGTSIRYAISRLLDFAGVPAFVVDDSDGVLGKAVGIDVGRKLLDFINELCALGGYYSLFFDNAGVARVREIPALEAGTIRSVRDQLPSAPASTVTLRYGIPEGHGSDIQPILQGSIAESDDLLEAPNRYLVIDNGATENPIWGWWDVPDAAPHSFANRGVRITRSYNIQGLRDKTQAANVARIKGMQDRTTFQWATFAAAPNPLHDTFDAVEYFAERWHEQQWSLTLAAEAKHTHEIRRAWGGTTE
jgi:hypothetical protein